MPMSVAAHSSCTHEPVVKEHIILTISKSSTSAYTNSAIKTLLNIFKEQTLLCDLLDLNQRPLALQANALPGWAKATSCLGCPPGLKNRLQTFLSGDTCKFRSKQCTCKQRCLGFIVEWGRLELPTTCVFSAVLYIGAIIPCLRDILNKLFFL